MNMNMNKMNNGKLIAAVAIFAMIACCLTVISFDDVNAAPAEELPEASNGVITVNENGITLTEDKTVTDRLAINGTLTVPAGVTLTINYGFSTAGESIITFGATGCLDVKGTVVINAGNDAAYTSPSGNHVFNAGATTYANDSVKVSGNLTITETSTVKGVLNYGPLSMVVTSGNVVINGNGMATTYFQQSGGNIDITLNDGSVSAYVDVTGGSFTVGGTCTTESSLNPNKNIFTPYAMHIGEGASFTANGKVGIYSGSVQSAIADNVNLAIKTLDVDEGASVTVGTEGSIDVPTGSTFNNDGDMNLYGPVTGTVNNAGTIRLLSEDASAAEATGTGSIDASAISNEGTISGTYGDEGTANTFDVSTNQIVTVTDNLTLVNNFQINVMGTLIIPEGVTVTIRDSAGINLNNQAAKVENNGTIIIESTSAISGQAASAGLSINSGVFTNNGTVNGQYLAVESDNYAVHTVFTITANGTFQNNNTVTIGSESGIAVNGKFVNAADATLALNGIANGTIQNAGTVNVNLAGSSDVTISLSAAGAVVNANSVTGTVKVDDKLLKSEDIENSDLYSQLNIYSKESAIKGVTVTSAIITEDEKDYKALQIGGTAVVSGDSTEGSLRALGDRIVVADALSIGKGVTLNIGDSSVAATNMYVSGDMTIVTDAKIGFQAANGQNPVIYVEGSITSAYSLMRTGTNVTGTPAMNAAYYYIDGTEGTTHYYTTLTAALASEATTVTVYGTVEVTVDTEIASGKTVSQDASSVIKIAEGITLSAVDGSKITQAGTSSITVEGTLYLANERNILRNGNITADVRSSNGTDARYTNLANAISLAEDGDKIELYSNPVTVSSPLTIKEGVTVDTAGKKLIIDGTTVTVNGTLYINGTTSNSLEVKDGTQKADIVVNGYIKSQNLIAYDASSWTPSGAYYSSVENGSRYYYITTAANGIANVNNSYDGVTLNGTLSLGNVTIAGTEDKNAVVNIAGTVSGNITLDKAVLNVTGALTGSVTDGNGTVALPANTAYTNAKFSVIAGEEDAVAFVVSGQIDAYTDRTITVTGDVTLSGATINDLTVDGNVTVEGTVYVTTLLVNGTVNVDNEAYLYVNKAGDVATVLGTLNVAEASNTAGGAGTADFDSLYVGIDLENPAVGVAATISGNVTSDNTYVASSATVPESLVKEDSTIEFFVEGTLWITFYGNKAVVTNAPVQDALFLGWATDADAEEPSITKAEAANGIAPSDVSEGVLYAIVDYKIYNVTIITDGGVASVAIDGSILSQGSNQGTVQGSNVFVLTGLTAGEHKLTYTLKAGFEGTPTMTINGEAITGDIFTLSGTPEGDADHVDVTINLAGTQPATGTTGSSDDGMGLTEILLIILVVLIVIMAIMVALRLMRS